MKKPPSTKSAGPTDSDRDATASGSEVIEHRRVLDCSVFSVDHDRVQLPHGRIVEVDVIRHPPSAVIIAMPEPGHLILVRQYRYAVKRWLWELPGGSADPGESIEDAARRECHEEIGQVPDTLVRLAAMFPTPGYTDEEMFFFRASGLSEPEHEAEIDEDEDLEVRIFTLKEAREMVRRGEIVDMKTVIGLSLL